MKLTENSAWFIKLCQENDIDFVDFLTNDVNEGSRKRFISKCELHHNPLGSARCWDRTSVGEEKLFKFNKVVNRYALEKYNRF